MQFLEVFRLRQSQHQQHASFLGQTYDPFFIQQDPNADDFRLPELSLPAGLNTERLNSRREVTNLIDRSTALLDLDVAARLICVDLQKHVADAQGHALVMGDDDLDLLHVGQYRGITTDCRWVYFVRLRG